MPEWYIDWDDSADVFQISASLVRLSKLGLIELLLDRTAGSDGYDKLTASPALNEIVQRYQAANPHQELELRSMHSILYVNDYGKQFAKTCLDS